MSGDGVVSVRLPSSLRVTLEFQVTRQGITVHEAAKRLLEGLSSFSDADLRSLPEPPKEITNQRLSFYVGWKQLDGLHNLSRISRLSFSGIFRRLLHALLVTHRIHFVQKEPGKPFYLEIKKADETISLLSRQHRGKT
jgi:hypothetical protein